MIETIKIDHALTRPHCKHRVLRDVTIDGCGKDERVSNRDNTHDLAVAQYWDMPEAMLVHRLHGIGKVGFRAHEDDGFGQNVFDFQVLQSCAPIGKLCYQVSLRNHPYQFAIVSQHRHCTNAVGLQLDCSILCAVVRPASNSFLLNFLQISANFHPSFSLNRLQLLLAQELAVLFPQMEIAQQIATDAK